MDANVAWQGLLSVLFLPFLNTAVIYAWGAGDVTWLCWAKRLLLLLPVLAIILSYWASILGFLTVPFRSDRKAFVAAILVTWWELGRGIFSFWGGIFKFALVFVATIFNFIRLMILGVWALAQDILFMPLRAAANVGGSILNPSLPWIAIFLTLIWAFFEALIFTFVMTPLVVDTLSNMTGSQLSIAFVRFPVFLFMLFLILGSYAVLSTWADALKTKDVASIVKIGAIEAVAAFVEVVFLYREFVDALMPWFAQHSAGGFELGIVGTLLIAGMTWFGIRAVSWFLFASAGTPVIMGIIQGKAMKPTRGHAESVSKRSFALTSQMITQMKSEGVWIEKHGEALVGAFIIPPLQVVAGASNFCTLLIITQHVFELPFRTLDDLKDARTLLKGMGQPALRSEKRGA
jgi:hypothetical protein